MIRFSFKTSVKEVRVRIHKRGHDGDSFAFAMLVMELQFTCQTPVQDRATTSLGINTGCRKTTGSSFEPSLLARTTYRFLLHLPRDTLPLLLLGGLNLNMTNEEPAFFPETTFALRAYETLLVVFAT